MTLDEVRALLIPVALALRAEFDGPTQRAYQRVLNNVPANLVVVGLEQLLDAAPRFMPNATELQAAAEKARRQMLAANPYEGCAECETQRGWRTLVTEGGQKTVTPCPCKARHQRKLTRLGLMEKVADLPGEAGVGENETVYPTLEQLPESIRQRIEAMATQKALR